MTVPDLYATAEQLADLLRWYGEMGVDAVVDETSHDRFAEAARLGSAPVTAPMASLAPMTTDAPAIGPEARPRPPLRERAPAPVAAVARPMDALALSVEAAVASARTAAAGAPTLDELRAILEAFEGCALKRSASRLVFADGNPLAKIMLVGEAPGAEEDRSGVPFVGRGGQLLDRMLASIGLDRSRVYVANVVPWRPPGNRTPTPQEVATCLPFITRQIELVGPDVLLMLGGSAMQALNPGKDGILRARGKWIDYACGGRLIKAMPMLHPAYLLRQPAQKKLAWRDMRALARALGPVGLGAPSDGQPASASGDPQ